MSALEIYQEPCKTSILESFVSFAKAEIIEEQLPAGTDVVEVALDYCHQLGVNHGDFAAIDCENIPAWVGIRPIKVPR